MAITYETAKKDIKDFMKRISTVGAGTETDRASQMILQSMDVLEDRLGDPKQINFLYFKIMDSSKALPSEVYNLVKDYDQGKIDEKTARQNLGNIKMQYEEVFKKMGIKPQSPKILFHKFP
jgi:hypothetical protein